MQRSTKRRDNQMLDPQGGEFHFTARASQILSMTVSTVFYLDFDFLGGADAIPLEYSDLYSADIHIIGSTPKSYGQSPISVNWVVWKGEVVFGALYDKGFQNIVPTGGAIAKVADSSAAGGSGNGYATPSISGSVSEAKIKMTVTHTADIDWVGKLSGLRVLGGGYQT